MPRVKPHAKLHVSIRSHRKTAGLYADNDAFATYARLLLLAVERYADRTGDSFTVHDSELPLITGKGRRDIARTYLEHLADISPISAERRGDIWLISVPNFAKKQGFTEKNGAGTGNPSSSASSSASSKEQELREDPPTPPAARGDTGEPCSAAPSPPEGEEQTPPERERPARRTREPLRTSAPDALSSEDRDRLTAWCRETYPALVSELPRIAASVLDWGRGKGIQRADWVATIRNAVREDAKRAGQQRTVRVNEYPRERGQRGGGVTPLFGGSR